MLSRGVVKISGLRVLASAMRSRKEREGLEEYLPVRLETMRCIDFVEDLVREER